MKTKRGQIKRGPEEPAKVRALRQLLDLLKTKRRKEREDYLDLYKTRLLDDRITHVQKMLADLERRETQR